MCTNMPYFKNFAQSEENILKSLYPDTWDEILKFNNQPRTINTISKTSDNGWGCANNTADIHICLDKGYDVL